jgi:predicted metal-dependent peptidase
MKNLEIVIYKLLHAEPFFAHFLLGAKITYDMPGVPTAGARIHRGDIEFVFNTEWFFSKPIEQQIGIAKHEIMHIILDHCGKRSGGFENMMAKNVAMDCAINQYIEGLPKDGVSLEMVRKMTGRNLEAFQTWEYYYEAIKQAAKDEAGPDHTFMESGSSNPDNVNKAIIKNATSKAMSAAAGKIPNGLAGVIASMNAPAQLPWKQILRNFVANCRSIENKVTRLRTNRRFDLEQPGKKKLKKLRLGVCIDESGSVSDESFNKFMNEIKSLAKGTTVTYIVHADCEVHKVDTIKNGKVNTKVVGQRQSSGGTAYQPAIDECKKRHCDVIIYCGDFDCADKPVNPGIPFLWVGVGNSPPPAEFGKVLRLT